MQQQRLTPTERYSISALLSIGHSIRSISRHLNRHHSVVCREVLRNSQQGRYDASEAHSRALLRQATSHTTIRFTSEIRDLVSDYLRIDWSPDQISQYLKMEYGKKISVQRIYQFVADDRREGGSLYRHLRHGLKRRKRYGSHEYRGRIIDRVSIDDRPALVNEQRRVGDFEIDTIIGQHHQQAVVTVVDRKSLFTLVGKVDKNDAESVSRMTISLLKPFLPAVKTITADNGKEFATHKKVALELNCDYYFAHPNAPWERGINENTNGLIRQYLPKGTSFLHVGERQTNFIMNRLNNRPRKKLGYKTPKQVFAESIRKYYLQNTTGALTT